MPNYNTPAMYKPWVDRYQRHLEGEQKKGASREEQMDIFAQLMASQMLANDPTLGKLTKRDGKVVDRPEISNIGDVSVTLKKSAVFQSMTQDKSPQELMEMAKDPKTFTTDMEKMENHYSELAENADTVDVVSKNIINNLKETGTGRNWLGIKRSKNSPEYDNMLSAMNESAKPNQTPEERKKNILNAVDATKKYLSDKKTVRGSEDGQIRFNNAMRFLYVAMPPEEFQDYCDEINHARGAKYLNDKNRIEPEDFAPRQENVKKEVKPQPKEEKEPEPEKDVIHDVITKKEQRNRDRKEYLEDLKKADPQEYQKLKTQNDNLKNLKNAAPEEYEKQNKAHLADLDKRVNQHKKELQATHALDKESARHKWIENKQKELKQEGPQQQKKPGPQQQKKPEAPALGL